MNDKAIERLRYIEGMVNVVAFAVLKDGLGWAWYWVLLLMVGLNVLDICLQAGIRGMRK